MNKYLNFGKTFLSQAPQETQTQAPAKVETYDEYIKRGGKVTKVKTVPILWIYRVNQTRMSLHKGKE